MDVATHEFDRDTAVEAVGAGSYRGRVHPGYSIGQYPNGGYVLSIALRAVAAELPLPDPLAVSAHYLTPSVHGAPIDVEVEVIRAGRGTATAQARCSQDGVERFRVLATFGDLERAAGATVELGSPPYLPPIEECSGRDDPSAAGDATMPNGLVATIRDRFDTHLDPATLGWRSGHLSGRGVIQGYARFRDGREPDLMSMMLVADSFPPAVFDLASGGWVPTIEFTVHCRARPAPGWLRCRFSTAHLRDGYLEEDGEVWDSDGTLVCQSRQLARFNLARA